MTAAAMTVEQLITDNGTADTAKAHAIGCRVLGIRRIRTRPRRPQTNGKAERFIRTIFAGWAYGAIYSSRQDRTAALDGWLWHYNHHRRHTALGQKPPIARLTERTNFLGTYTYPSSGPHEGSSTSVGAAKTLSSPPPSAPTVSISSPPSKPRKRRNRTRRPDGE
jgi:hypothetical protein